MIERVDIEIVPTVTLGSAISCITIVNMFLGANDKFRLERIGGKYVITDEPTNAKGRTQ